MSTNNDIFGIRQQIVWWHEGRNTAAVLTDVCKQRRNVLLVYDARAYPICGAKEFLEDVLVENAVYTCPVDFSLPSFSILQRVLSERSIMDVDLIVAVGGGATIDFAKLLRYYGGRAAQGEINSFDELIGLPLDVPLIAIPTTSGSGSEATPFAVLYVEGVKHSISHPSILPDYAYLYPALTSTLPAMQRAATGLDALCQAIESYWSVGATTDSREISRVAIQEARKHLVQHVKNPDEESRIGMVMASHMAGRAIAATRTTVCHALSYTMTSEYGIPHGIAVALTLGPALVYNAQVTPNDTADPRGVDFVQASMRALIKLLGYATAEEARDGIYALLDGVVGGHKVEDFGIESQEDMQYIASQVNPERLKNNPRNMTEAALASLLA